MDPYLRYLIGFMDMDPDPVDPYLRYLIGFMDMEPDPDSYYLSKKFQNSSSIFYNI